MRLTQTSLVRIALPAGIDDKIFFDEELPGFGLRLRAGGSRKSSTIAKAEHNAVTPSARPTC